MFEFIKRLLGREYIEKKAIEHSSKGEYTKSNRLKGGGHGQEAIEYMDENKITYNITDTYPNGVRIGNVPNHEKAKKRQGNNQSWFPATWKRDNIEKAGKSIARGRKYPDGKIKSGKHKNVDVGIIRTNGKIATIFPLTKQSRRKK